MVLTPLRVLLLIAGVLVAGVVVHLAGIFNPQGEQQPQAAVNGPLSGQRAESGAAAEKPASEAPVVAEAGEEGKAGDEQVVVPAFDLLRAEPDGSLVVAGRAEAGAEVEIVSGSSVLAKATAGPGGDFAAILDDPLEPGEHNIVLRATSKDRVSATSLETAIVSIPTAESGQVVALVQQPGEPSRLITAPVAEAQMPEEPQRIARAPEDASPPAGQGTSEVSREQAGSGGASAGEDAPKEPDGTGDVARSDPGGAPAGEGDTAASADAAEAPENDAPFIEAVEIDGRDVFVAGRAEPGHTVRVYANDILLGQTDISQEGRFLIEAERDLPVGDYIVRADVLGEDGSTVVSRAAVPFERPEGEKISAVAPQTLSSRKPSERSEAAVPSGDRLGETPQAAPATDDQGHGAGTAAYEAGTPSGNGRRAGDAQGRLGEQMGARSANAPQRAGSEADAASSGMTSPALEPVDGSVIIRRGDTLWHISRRVYGRGIRYTTIYLANQSQISDPDLIWPGQVFTVPNETEEGEKADLDAIGGQTPELGQSAERSGQ